MIDEKSIVAVALDCIAPTVTGCRSIGWDVVTNGGEVKLNFVTLNILRIDGIEEPFTKCSNVVTMLFQRGESNLDWLDRAIGDLDRLLLHEGDYFYSHNFLQDDDGELAKKGMRSVDLNSIVKEKIFTYDIDDNFKFTMEYGRNEHMQLSFFSTDGDRMRQCVSIGITQSDESLKFCPESYLMKYLRVYSAFRNIRSRLADALGLEQFNYSKEDIAV